MLPLTPCLLPGASLPSSLYSLYLLILSQGIKTLHNENQGANGQALKLPERLSSLQGVLLLRLVILGTTKYRGINPSWYFAWVI